MHQVTTTSNTSAAALLSDVVPVITATAALERIANWTDLEPTKRRDHASALRTVCRWLGYPAGDMVLSPAFLRDNLLCRSAATFGVGDGRWKNIKSSLRVIMIRLELIDDPAAPISSTWALLLQPLDLRERPLLEALARFCDQRATAPSDVSDKVLEAFEVRLAARSLRPKPRKFVGEVRGCWNRAAQVVPGWPLSLSARRPDPDHYTLTLSAFTPSLQVDIAAFCKQLAADPLDDDAELVEGDDDADTKPLPLTRQLRGSTVENKMDHARWAASTLIKTGVPIEDIHMLADLVQPLLRARDILRFHRDRAQQLTGSDGSGRSSAGHHIANVLRIIARHHVRLPESEVRKIITWGSSVTLKYKNMTDKNERTVREALMPEREIVLLGLPEDLLKAALKLLEKAMDDGKNQVPQGAVGLALRAIALELLTKVPNRLQNLIGLQLDRHLQRSGDGTVTHIHVPGSETKHKRLIAVPVASATAQLLKVWLKDFRPYIAEPGNPYLFPGMASATNSITPQGMRDAIKESTLEYVGVTITPHQFRHIAAHQLLRASPGNYGLVKQLLGHSSVEVTRKSYCSIEQEQAIRFHDDLLNNRLADLRREQKGELKRGGRVRGKG